MTVSTTQNSSHTTQTTVYLPNILLDESNYPTWLFRMESFLRGQNLFGFVDGSIPCPPQCVLSTDGTTSTPSADYITWKTQDQSIVNMIGQTLSAVAMNCAVGSKSAQDLWTRLRLKFADANKQNILQLKSNLQNVKKGSDDIETYLDKIKAAKDALETVGVVIDDEDIVVTVLNGLPSEFAAIKTVIRAQFTCSPLSQLKTLLKAAEMDISNEVPGIQSLITAMLANCNFNALTTPAASSSSAQSCPSSSLPAAQSQTHVHPFSAMQTQVQTSVQNHPVQPSSPMQPAVSSAASSSYSTQGLLSSAPTVPPGFAAPTLPSYPLSAQNPYVPIPTMPYGFTSIPSFPMFNTPMPYGFYAGRGNDRFNNNGGRGNGNNFGGKGNQQNGGFNNQGGAFRNNANNGNSLTCQWCNKIGHSAKTCRSLPNAQQGNNVTQGGCQYCGKPGHTADRCYFIIGFPGQQNDTETENATAMLAATNLAPQYWLADTGATNHMTNNLQLLHNITSYPTNDGVQIGQGAGQNFVPGTE
ncbi:putative transcription factor interactor and regulator CCHC(Zn) family [Rosa chinensis]|uniref:Putative transcription factor interactor and regulator CCHC(Zn) family n=1 Tax=Rosa chinensis TaxID=74649 RepID=A0A2P6R0S2_ROSCH|nr:putative transcription factor interactor and regulator CCHC(Zn) family [Rosa chinensis]